MMLLRKLLGISALLILFFACQKELSLENAGQITGSQWSFKEGSSEFKGPVDTAYLTDIPGGQTLSIEGSSVDGKGVFVIQVFTNSTIKPGVFKTPNVFFNYEISGSSEYLNDVTALDKFTVTIITLDSVSVTGTFSGEVLDKTTNVKTVTEGKFSAKLKNTTVTPPPVGNCKISNIGYFELGGTDGYASLTSTFNPQNLVNKVQLLDSVNSNIITEFNISYAANRVNLAPDQWFILDASGRVSEYHGYLDADSTTGFKCIGTYTYDANGYMTKVTYAAQTAPSTVLITGTFTWTGGNLTKTVVEATGLTEKIEFTYTYDATKTAKNFLTFLPINEIIYNQSAINFGKNSTNVPLKSVYAYTKAGVTSTETSDYTAYIVDANNYVKGFVLTGNGSVYFPDTKYVLTYKCF